MSADNWTTCPRCVRQYQAHLAQLVRDLDVAYGKVTPVEYERQRQALADAQAEEIDHTFREDYSIGINDDDTFSVDYGGCCTACKLSVRFTHTASIKEIVCA